MQNRPTRFLHFFADDLWHLYERQFDFEPMFINQLVGLGGIAEGEY